MPNTIINSEHYSGCLFKENPQFVQKVSFGPLMNFKQKPLQKLEMLQKLLLLKVFSTKFIKTHNYFLLWQCFLIIFMRQTLTDDFWGLHKNKNCAFPLTITGKLLNIFEVEYLWITVNYVICILWFLVFLYFFVFILNMEFTL